MAKNTLYNFIDLYINGKKGLANVIALKPMETRDKKKYFLLQLKLSKAIYFKSNKQVLELVEHHISIYKTEHSYDPALSQYHYTAKLEGPNKTFYTLHVYFNENGQITKAPVLSLIENEKPSPVQITEKKACQFVAQAEAAIRPTIMQLNAAKIECIDQLKRQFEEEDEKATALSTDLKSNAVQHKLVIQKMINLARQLNPLFKHEKYAMSAQMLGELQYSPTPERKKGSLSVQETSREKKPTAHQGRPKITPPIKTSHKAKKDPEQDFSKELQQLRRKFAKLNLEDPGSYAEALCHLFADTNQLSVISIESNPSKTLLGDLAALRLQIQSRGKKLLKQLLVQENYLLANTLYPFHFTLEHGLINNALSTGNANLLHFLIQCGEYDLNTQPIKINQTEYPSAMHYCLSACHTGIDMTACFKTLLEHNASLLVPDNTGIPLAHVILKDLNHPLRETLLASKKLTRDFYFKLVGYLDRHLSDARLSEEEKNVLLIDIDVYHNRAQSLLLADELHDIAAVSSVTNMTKLASFIGSEWTYKLEREPAIISANRRFNEFVLDLSRKRVHGNENRKRRIKQMIEQLLSSFPDHIATLDYEAVIKWRLNLLNNAHKLFLEMDSFITLAPAGSRRKVCQAGQQLLTQCDALFEAATEYTPQNRYSFYFAALNGSIVCPIRDNNETVAESNASLESLTNPS